MTHLYCLRLWLTPLHNSRLQPLLIVIFRLLRVACLIRPEFERRDNAMPNLKKAELIEGFRKNSFRCSLFQYKCTTIRLKAEIII